MMSPPHQPEIPEQLLTVEQAAKVLNVSTTWLYRYAKAGKIPTTRLGGNLRFTGAQLHQIIASAESPAVGVVRRGSARTRL